MIMIEIVKVYRFLSFWVATGAHRIEKRVSKWVGVSFNVDEIEQRFNREHSVNSKFIFLSIN